jgi:hypothetical protein
VAGSRSSGGAPILAHQRHERRNVALARRRRGDAPRDHARAPGAAHGSIISPHSVTAETASVTRTSSSEHAPGLGRELAPDRKGSRPRRRRSGDLHIEVPLQTRDRRRGSTYCVRLEFPFASGETAVSGWHSSRVFHLIAVQGHACSAAPAGNGHAPRRHARGPLSNARWHSRGSRGSISPCRKSSYDVIVPPGRAKSSPCRTSQGWWQIHSCS